jgi:chromosomal replication initiation ATPase DnaA
MSTVIDDARNDIDAKIAQLQRRKLKLIELGKLQDEVRGMELKLFRNLPAAAKTVVALICRHFDCDESALLSPLRCQPIAFQRQVAMCLMRETVHSTLGSIGKTFARDRGTVLHACRTVHNRCDTDREFAAEFKALTVECIELLEKLQEQASLEKEPCKSEI